MKDGFKGALAAVRLTNQAPRMPLFAAMLVWLAMLLAAGQARAQGSVDMRRVLEEERFFFMEFGPLLRQLNAPSFQESLTHWASQGNRFSVLDRHVQYVNGFQQTFQGIVRSPLLVLAMAYFIRIGQTAEARQVLELYYRQMLLFLREVSADPRYPAYAALKNRLDGYAAQLEEFDALTGQLLNVRINAQGWDPLIDELVSDLKKAGGIYTFNHLEKIWPFFGITDLLPGYQGPWRPVSFTGFIPGNRITYFEGTAFESKGAEYLNYISDRLGIMKRHGYATEQGKIMSVESFKSRLRGGEPVFSEDGFEGSSEHMAFEDIGRNIFRQARLMISEAKKTIFLDMFFLGGTIGASLAKELIARADAGVKVFVLRDFYNHFGWRSEMMPVANYLRAYSELNPGKLIIVPAVVDLHPLGVPVFVDRLLNDELFGKVLNGHFGADPLREGLLVHPKGRADHSKILMTDACSADYGNRVLVGSKNWTDSSGGVTKDDAIVIEGPAACAFQSQYFRDMLLALSRDEYREKFDATAMAAHAYLKLHAAAGGNQETCASQECLAGRIAALFDPLDARSGAPDGMKFPAKGNAVVRIGESNIDGTVSSFLDQVVQAILNAKSQVLIKDLYLFAQPVVDAVVTAVRRNKNLRIHVVVDGFDNTEAPTGSESLVNQAYLDQLYALNKVDDIRVHVKFFVPDYKHSGMNQEFHHKSMSVDGFGPDGVQRPGVPLAIIGSANFDIVTMQGSFREAQAEVFDQGLVKDYDASFWQLWKSANVRDAYPLDFVLPPPFESVSKPLVLDMMKQFIEPFFQVEVIHDL